MHVQAKPARSAMSSSSYATTPTRSPIRSRPTLFHQHNVVKQLERFECLHLHLLHNHCARTLTRYLCRSGRSTEPLLTFSLPQRLADHCLHLRRCSRRHVRTGQYSMPSSCAARSHQGLGDAQLRTLSWRTSPLAKRLCHFVRCTES